MIQMCLGAVSRRNTNVVLVRTSWFSGSTARPLWPEPRFAFNDPRMNFSLIVHEAKNVSKISLLRGFSTGCLMPEQISVARLYRYSP
jgi:hypothetical protein